MLADRIGAARALLVGCPLLLVATYALYLGVAANADALPVLYALAGFCVGVVGVIPALLVAAFPPAVRFTGISFAYNVAYAIVGGVTPLVVATLDEIGRAGAGALRCRVVRGRHRRRLVRRPAARGVCGVARVEPDRHRHIPAARQHQSVADAARIRGQWRERVGLAIILHDKTQGKSPA